MIPNALREGVLRLARAGIEINMAKLGVKIGDAADAGEGPLRSPVSHGA